MATGGSRRLIGMRYGKREKAMALTSRERQKRFRSRRVRSGNREVKFWVPDDRVDEVRAAVVRILEAEPELPFEKLMRPDQAGPQ